MHLDRYEFSVNEILLDYEFESHGPNGKFKKLVSFIPQNVNGTTYFNLGFGDFNPASGQIDDLSVSDNKDKEKILATIAKIVLEFTDSFPDIPVYAKGSAAARTRLYQMGINAKQSDIEPLLSVFGFRDNKWHHFEKNINYDAFLTKRKKL